MVDDEIKMKTFPRPSCDKTGGQSEPVEESFLRGLSALYRNDAALLTPIPVAPLSRSHTSQSEILTLKLKTIFVFKVSLKTKRILNIPIKLRGARHAVSLRARILPDMTNLPKKEFRCVVLQRT